MLISDVSGAVIGGKFGQVNPRGIMFYNKLIDNLLERGNFFLLLCRFLDISRN